MKHNHESKYENGKKWMLYSITALIVIIILQAITYLGLFQNIPNFISKYGWWIFYLDISIVAIVAALSYYYSYEGFQSCMASMMIGMTFGMQIGMMLGAVFGAVNGYFIGAMIGMITGTLAGLITGKKSTMGLMQGMMSGVMGGTMGAMITMMMFTDHVLYFMPLYIIINIAILILFMRMYNEEVIKDNKEVVKKEVDAFTFVSICVITAVILTAILIYAPKSLLFGA